MDILVCVSVDYTMISYDFYFQVEVMKGNVDSRVKAFQQDIEKFAARWHQLKPGDDALEGDKEKTKKAIELIKEKRQEFNELEENRKKIVYVFLLS